MLHAATKFKPIPGSLQSLHGATNQFALNCRPFSSETAAHTYYEILGVSHQASVTEIKKAFRKKAKLAHPDTSNSAGGVTKEQLSFAAVLQAYQVLTNARERQLYDLAIDSRTGRFVKSAVHLQNHQSPFAHRKGDQKGTQHREPNDGWIRQGSWADWAATAPAPRRPDNVVDQYRQHLQVEFRQALRHAYLGPELDLGKEELPECFEADERSQADAKDLLHLVSGRSLLGSVRLRQQENIPGGSPMGSELPVACETVMPFREAIDQHSTEQSSAAGYPKEISDSNAPKIGNVVNPSQIPVSGADGDDESASSIGRDTCPPESAGPAPVILEMRVDESAVAYGVRQQGSSEQETLFLNKKGIVFAHERKGRISKVTPGSDWRQPGSLQQSAHEIVRGRTPFVRHLQFLGYNGGQRVSLCKCRRAWLPPSRFWIFPPRSDQHQRRSWYFEWTGHQLSQHPLWLPPSVFVLTAAFESLEDEAREEAASRSQTVFHRAKRWIKQSSGLI